MVEPFPAEPIFIHGILPRSGTNFLWDLLLLHPDCARGREPVNEDLFLEHSEHLAAFVDAAHAAWDPNWGTVTTDTLEQLYENIGNGLVSFLWTDRSRRLVGKSPSVRHLERFFRFFPRARLLILIRDGRSVAQSAMQTFGWSFDRASLAWVEGARTIRRFQQVEADRASRWRLVRYEDLVDDPERELRSIFEFLGLDATRYDYAAARNLPVRGSSAFGRTDGKVQWDPVAKDRSFAPRERWRSWTAAQLERFDWLAGEHLLYFGYISSRHRFSGIRSAAHTLRDNWWHLRRNVRLSLYQMRVRLALRSRIASTLKSLRIGPLAR